MAMSTIKEVSELAGVSQATVSRVMNGSDRVTDETRKKVQSAMKELGYRPNSAARSLATSRTDTIGMVVSWLDGPFYGPVMSGIEEALREKGKHLIIAAGHGNTEQEMDAISYLSSRQVDGLILLTECLDAQYLRELNDKIPIYLINQHIKGLEERNMWLDNESGSYLATKHLIEQGHINIVYAGGQEFKQDANERVVGYKKALVEAGIEVKDSYITRTIFQVSGGIDAMNEFEQRGIKYTAVVAGCDEMAIGIIEWASQNKRSVPEELSVIGFDNVRFANYIRPRLTTMNFPIYEMAKASANMAHDEIYKKKPPHGLEFKPNLVVRDSVFNLNENK